MQQPVDGWTTRAAAAHLAVPVTTIKAWLAALGTAPARNHRGEWRLSDAQLALLERVRELRADGLGLGAIAAQLAGDDPPAVGENLPPAGHSSTDLVPIAAVRDVAHLARELADAAHQLGRVEAQVEALQVMLQAEQARSADARALAETAQHERAAALEQVARLRGELDQLRASSVEPPRRRWWWPWGHAKTTPGH